MNYLKFYNGGIVKKLEFGGNVQDIAQQLFDEAQDSPNPLTWDLAINIASLTGEDPYGNLAYYNAVLGAKENGMTDELASAFAGGTMMDNLKSQIKAENKEKLKAGVTGFGKSISGVDFSQNASWRQSGLSEGAAMGMGIVANLGTQAINAVDTAFMGDKNFSSGSQALDSAVHGTSSMLLKSGNPYAMAAGVALEGANFLTKAGGLTVQGFDANIENSGFGTLGHEDSSSSRDFGALIGLGGLNQKKIQAKLDRRNERARMALEAAEISDDIKFEQEARANSVDNVIMQNEIALNGGVDTQVLAAKLGAKLEAKQKRHIIYCYSTPIKYCYLEEIPSAKNGAKLEKIEVSEQPNVIPEGAMHKNLNHIDLDVTKKGIPVITVEDDSADTFAEIKQQEDTLVLHAEVEEAEIIFNKELTLFIENLRKLWHEEKDDSICLEAGMRLAKEILENTEDNTDVTEKSMEAVENENN